ncbi:MAG: hypothetical protein UV74_C0013G0472 [Candidatus Woesebacteria bacterium GW2011_GWB1_43_14]|uniref:Uncharacterized protein n=1 Tax=Candidatus Woesebacteria bacterium GW2011_GWB1_43_14 TaxID=1618578 RepID=A0A0G1DHK8_9BACT|nr:MAG: hypothetical protein UT21_C0001G0184 [Candidatus Woesebacteria bacterium GW2011_GWA1_39_11b]KKS78070.1 MAG: hypothetical protein UV51_C0003G0105 [Candidatus Woesebacteria bacterium GW2011_GWC1_42_9]KKS97350.1 MAG: hypothetical protein UV74_C0013G0472 [Candidatus Woesebacteria bacterium GW2011_GWB1_43_14]
MPKRTVTAEEFRQKLKLKHLETKKKFSKKYFKFEKRLSKKGIELGKLRGHSTKLLSAGALTGTLLLTQPSGLSDLPGPSDLIGKIKPEVKVAEVKSPRVSFLSSIQSVLPGQVRPLISEEEKRIEQILEENLNIPAKATLEGEHLNTTYGRIGAEQHLRRFPGDTLGGHGEGGVLKEGIAPGLGAWGYFAPSKAELNPELVETEKWYAVCQTLYLPDWNTRTRYLRDWYKYRKVLIVNTDNGKAVVAAIADSGPAAWTGKHFGGSPEVMNHLGGPRYKKGPVLFFFVDDPENKIPLGPVEYDTLGMKV